MHQLSDESELLELKPQGIDAPATSIDQVLEIARARSLVRDIERSRDRRMPQLAPAENRFVRLLWFVLALALIWGLFYVVRSFWAPSHPGVDQNGYQVGGKLFAKTLSTGYKPASPFSYVGWMWVQTPDGWMYPKYPLGVPVLDAICLWLAPTYHQGIEWSYFVSPVCTVLAAAAMFLMLRTVASSFAAVLGLILMASNPVALVLANNSNSHAAAIGFASWGILFLIWWMRYGSWWRGVMAGLLLGYAFTIRYTEGLLVLPILAATLTAMRYERRRDIRWWAAGAWIALAILAMVLRSSTKIPTHGWHLWAPLAVVAVLFTLAPSRTSAANVGLRYIVESLRSIVCAAIVFGVVSIDLSGMHWKSIVDQGIVGSILLVSGLGLIPLIYAIHWAEPRTYLRPAVTLLGWLIPVAALVLFNRFAMGSWTGYDTTNESDGFSWNYFIDKWDFMVGQVYNTGLFFIAPLGIAGMFLMFRTSARLAAVMTLWFVPGLLLYSAYYWGLNTPGVAYLRFFLTLFPPIVFCTAWLLDHVARGLVELPKKRGAIAAPISAGVIVAIAAAMNVKASVGPMERDFTIQTNLADAADHVLRKTMPAQKLGYESDWYESDLAHCPVLFGDGRQFLNYIQYAGNFQCYAMDAFTSRGGMRRSVDPDMPNPLQKLRIDEMKKFYASKSDDDLWHEETSLINQAIASQRRVFAALPAMFMPVFKSRFSRSDFNVVTIETWKDPVTMSKEASQAFAALGPAARFMGAFNTPQSWELCEITRKPPAPFKAAPVKPVVKSTTRPTTKPKAYFEIK